MADAVRETRAPLPQAFKFLAPDVLSSAIIGLKGAGIKEIQETAETKISIADRNNKYPGTNSRLVLIRGNGASSIERAMVSVIAKLKTLFDAPVKPDVDMTEFILKPGASDVRLRIIIPHLTGGALIGPAGARISELREKTGCRIRIEDGKIGSGDTAEQVVTLLGPLDSLTDCAAHINKVVQESAEQPWFSSWARLNINSKGTGRGSAGQYGGDGNGYGYNSPEDDMVLSIMRTIPRNLIESRTFAMQTSLPLSCMSGLIGKGGYVTKEITTLTGATVTLREADPNAMVALEGSMNAVLCAYMLVMKRYLELEMTGKGKGKATGGLGSGDEGKNAKVERLKRQATEIQAELHRLEGN